jgi:hypothetical protein
MNISLVSTNYYMSGSYINFLDLQHHLINESKHAITFYYTQLDKNGYWLPHMLEKTCRRYDMGNYMKLWGNVWIKDDVVITDFRGLVICHKWGIPFKCSKLIVMDSVELSYHLNDMPDATHWFDWDFCYNTPLDSYLDIHEYDEIIFLMPPVNVKTFEKRYPQLNAQEFHKKINYDALKSVRTSDNGKYCYRTDKPNLIYNALEKVDIYDNVDEQPQGSIFNYRGFIFHRRKRLQYWEQFGRLIFEYIMLGKEVKFAVNPYGIHDGLVDYMNHYGIEIDSSRNITTKKQGLIDRMQSPYEVKPWD